MEANKVEAPEVIRTPYERLAALNVNDKLEKKNGLSYLSWAWAVDQLLRADPLATWEYGTPVQYGETMMVFCTVTAFGQARTMQLPVMDHRNRAIANPDAFQVNTAMQRCLVKAIALHGLGLYVYAGEDLPPGEVDDEKKDDKKDERKPIPANLEGKEAFDALTTEMKDYYENHARNIAILPPGKVKAYLDDEGFTHEEMLMIWSRLSSDVRAAIKKAAKQPVAA